MSRHRRNPTTVSFPGSRGCADWHPPVHSLLQVPLTKESDEANMAAHYAVRTLVASSSLAVFFNHGWNKPRLLEQRTVFVFFAGFLFQASSSLRVCWSLMCNTPTFASAALLTERSGLSTKACRAEGREEVGIQRKKMCFPFLLNLSDLVNVFTIECFSQESFIQHSSDLSFM